jgi:predicted ABC-type ATPase
MDSQNRKNRERQPVTFGHDPDMLGELDEGDRVKLMLGKKKLNRVKDGNAQKVRDEYEVERFHSRHRGARMKAKHQKKIQEALQKAAGFDLIGGRPQSQFTGYTRIPGQVPGQTIPMGTRPRLDPETERALNAKPQGWNMERHFERTPQTAQDVVSGLGLSKAMEARLAKLVSRDVVSSPNRVHLAKSLMSTLLTEGLDPEVRVIVNHRALQLYQKVLQKSGYQEVFRPAELYDLQKAGQPKGGKYVKRVDGPDGKRRYYYNEDKYKQHHGDHVSGEDARKSYLTSKACAEVDKAGDAGCGIDAFKGLVQKYGHKEVHAAMKGAVDAGHVSYKKGKFYPGKKVKKGLHLIEPPAERLLIKAVTPIGGITPGGYKVALQGGKRVYIDPKTGQPTGTAHEDKQPRKPAAKKEARRLKPKTDEYIKAPWRTDPPEGFPPADMSKDEPGARGGTEQMHWDDATGDFTAERKKLHESIISKAFEGKTPINKGPKMAIVMMGGTASGKSTMLRNSGAAGENFVHVDADDIKGELPEYQEALSMKWQGAAAFAHEESSTLAKQMAKQAVDENYNIVLDGTGANEKKFLKQVRMLKENGYHVHLMMPDQDKDQAVSDAMKRANKTGRYVPPEFIESAYDKIPSNFFKVAAEADSGALYDRRQDGKMVWSKSTSGTHAHDPDFLKDYPNYPGEKK